MSGTQFVETLKRLSYPGVDDLDGQGFDWLFENEATLPFMEWLCTELQSSNRLTPQELEEFHDMEASEGVLEGHQLDEILRTQTSYSEEETSTDELRENVKRLEEELQSCQLRKEALIQQRNKLGMHHTALMDRVSKLDGIENGAKSAYKQSLEESHTDNSKVNQSLSDLAEAVTDISALYQRTAPWSPKQMKEPEQAIFLSQLNLQNYYKVEGNFTTQLTAFTKKQFFHGIAEMAGESEGSRYEFLEISNPDTLLVRGETEDVILEDCKELTRLQQNYPISEKRRVNLLLEEKNMVTACDFIEDKLRLIKSKPFSEDIAALSNKLKSAQSILATLKSDVAAYLGTEVPSLIQDSAMGQATKILRGDYELKITRQNYFISNQERLIAWLVKQRSHKEFLTMAYELESKHHRDIRRLLTAIGLTLQNNRRAYQQRMEIMTDPTLLGRGQPRSTLDSRDKATASLHKLLGTESGSDKPQLFVTYAQVADGAERLNETVTSLRGALASANTVQDDKLPLLETQLSSRQSFVYSDSATLGGAPVLSPRPVLDGIAQLESLLQRLEGAVVDTMKDTDHKKKVLQNDPLQKAERELYANFFTDPARLRRKLNEVQSRLEAQLIK